MKLKSFIVLFHVVVYVISGFAQYPIRSLNIGETAIVPFNKSASKYASFTVQNISFSDSTSSYCVINFDLLVRSIGKKTTLGAYNDFFGLNDNLCILKDDVTIAKNDSAVVSCNIYLHDGRPYMLQYRDFKLFNLPTYDADVFKQKQRAEQERIRAEFKTRQDSLNRSMFEHAERSRAHVKLNLLPQNMINFLGKIDRVGFEKLVGEPVGHEESFVVYNVINEYDGVETGIRCYYRESDGKLISVKFGTPHYLGFWINFTRLRGYPQKESVAKQKGNYTPKKDKFGQLYQINLKLGNFGCQIMDIYENINYSIAVINYHTAR